VAYEYVYVYVTVYDHGVVIVRLSEAGQVLVGHAADPLVDVVEVDQ